jgi:hypothetical protein
VVLLVHLLDMFSVKILQEVVLQIVLLLRIPMQIYMFENVYKIVQCFINMLSMDKEFARLFALLDYLWIIQLKNVNLLVL